MLAPKESKCNILTFQFVHATCNNISVSTWIILSVPDMQQKCKTHTYLFGSFIFINFGEACDWPQHQFIANTHIQTTVPVTQNTDYSRVY